MAIRLSQNSFLGGQLDFELMGRQDFARYAKGASKLCNFNIMKRGGLDKRRGFDRLVDLRATLGINKDTKIRLVPFAYKKTQGFVLIITPLNMYVVGTSPQNIYTVYSVTDGAGVYSSDEINELDYQQCGDVIFIAHQNHPPARVFHDINSNGEHGFHYEPLEVSGTTHGIPSITGATVNRTAVSTPNAGKYTEEYAVSAMFDGQETFTCTPYKDTNCVDNSSGYNGTTYFLPWTESQKITLKIKPSVRTLGDGTKQYPDEIRVYKKAFNYFGLIGTVRLSLDDVFRLLTRTSADSLIVKHSDTGTSFAEADVFAEAAHERRFGAGRSTLELKSGTHSFSMTSNKVGYVKIELGAAYLTVSGDTATFTYKAWDADAGLVVTCGGITRNVTLPQTIGSQTEQITKDEGESDEDFKLRYTDGFNAFVNRINDIDNTVIVSINGTDDATSVSIAVGGTGKSVAVNSIRAFSFADVDNVEFTDKYITPSSNITPPDRDSEGVFEGAGNYPASVSLSQQRLIWASSKNDPARVWLSATGDFYTYIPHEIQTPDDAIDFVLPVTRFAKINHIMEMRKLLMFNSACEWLVDSASSNSGITYETIQALPQSYSGSSERLKPIVCNNTLIFSERTGQSIRRFAYDLSNDGFAGRDVSILAYSIFENNSIIDWTYQQFPFSTLWCVLNDGRMASFEFMEEQDIMAWMTHEIGGGGKVKCVATTYAVSPALDEIRNVERYENATHEEILAVIVHGEEVWLERMRIRSEQEDSVYHSLCMDSVRVLNSTNGYQPLDDENLTYIPADTTDGKTISREAALQKLAEGVEVYEGYTYNSVYTSVFPTLGNGMVGDGQFDIKNVYGIALRLMGSVGGVVTPVGSKLPEPIPYHYNDPENDHRAVFGDGRVKLFNHDTNLMPVSGINTRDGRVTISQDDAFPFAVLSYEIDFDTENGGRRG